MRLIVGLGNPGKDYENTRHNIGYKFLDFITDNAIFSLNKKFNALEYDTSIEGERVLFIKPLTFMNNSGEAVIKYVNYYKLQITDVLVIQDDLDMETGKFKLIYNHGDGGHNGIKNIILNLGSKEFLRLKIGISKTNTDTKEYVLGNFSRNEMKSINNAFENLKDFLTDYLNLNKDLLMGKYNSRILNKIKE